MHKSIRPSVVFLHTICTLFLLVSDKICVCVFFKRIQDKNEFHTICILAFYICLSLSTSNYTNLPCRQDIDIHCLYIAIIMKC